MVNKIVDSLKFTANESSRFDFVEVDNDLNRIGPEQQYSNGLYKLAIDWLVRNYIGILILSFYSVIAGWLCHIFLNLHQVYLIK